MPEFKEILVKPHFNFIRILFSYNLFLNTLMSIVIFIGFLPFIIYHDFVNSFICFYILCTLLIILIAETITYMNYKTTAYKITDNKIEFTEGFINHKRASLKFKDIKEIHLIQSFIQRIFKLGTIKILTAGSDNGDNGGLTLSDIDLSDSLYAFLNKYTNSLLDHKTENNNDKTHRLTSDYSSNYLTMWATIHSFIVVFLISIASFAFTFYSKINISNSTFLLFLGTITAIFVGTFLLIKKILTLEYKNKKYIISPTKIESKTGFFNYHFTTINIKNIKTIQLKKGILQRKFGLGSIDIKSSANNPSNDKSAKGKNLCSNGITISNLKDSSKIYKLIQSLNNFANDKNIHNISNDKPKYTCKPTFNIFTKNEAYILFFFLLLFCSAPLLLSSSIKSAIIVFLVFFPLIYLSMYMEKKNYDCTTYNIYPTRIELHEGYLINKTCTISVNDICEVHMSESFFQKIFKLSSIVIITPASTGIAILDITNGKKVYTLLKELIKNKQIKESNFKETASNSITFDTKTTKDNYPILEETLNPEFVFLNLFLSKFFNAIPFIILLSLWITLEEDGNFLDILSILLTIGILLGIVISVICGLNYKKTKYVIYDDKINFTEGFFNNYCTSLKYCDAIEISFIQNVFQRIFNLGTIKILTSASEISNGLTLRDIYNPLKTYKQLQDAIKCHSCKTNDESLLIMDFKPSFVISYEILNIGVFILSLLLFISSIVFILFASNPKNFQLLMSSFVFSGIFVPASSITIAMSFYFIFSFVHRLTRIICERYKIYSDKIEFSFSFLTKYSTTIFNNKIKEVYVEEGPIQKIFNIGTLVLKTAATKIKGDAFFNITNIKKIENVLKKIQNNL